MNTIFKITSLAFLSASVATAAIAQDTKAAAPKSKSDSRQEIVIRKKGGKTEKMTIVVDGDNITINGKPADDYRNAGVTVMSRSRRLPDIAPVPAIESFDIAEALDAADVEPPMPPMPPVPPMPPNKAMLGVMTERAEGGVKIKEVTKESGAEKAGLQSGDIITKVGESAIKEPGDLIDAIGNYNPSDKVDITYLRGGKEAKTSVMLGENKNRNYTYNFDHDFNFDFPKGPAGDNFNFNFSRKPKMGMQIQDVEEGKGVNVKDVDDDSPASKAGMKKDDIITQINGKDVAGVDDVRDQLRDLKEGDTVKFTFKRSGKSQTSEIKIPKRLKSADL